MCAGGRAGGTGDSGGPGRPLVPIALAVLLVLAGCGDLVTVGRQGEPVGDRLGWEDGYWHDEALPVTTADGLNESERRAVVARAMARVEVVRQLEFRERVPVEVVSREEYRERYAPDFRGRDPAAFRAWTNQVWEALFLVDEGTNVSEARGTVFETAVVGFYSAKRGEIVVVSDTETPTIDRATLAHELVHALQDQHLSLGPGARTLDARLAANGLVEGDANAVQAEYVRRCDRQWECLARPERDRAERPAGFNRGVFLVVYAPYASGPGFVTTLRERGGWEAVTDAYDRFPASTEQVIHPRSYPDESPENVTVPDRSSAQWERFDLSPASDTVGEASIHAMFRINGQVVANDSSDYSHPRSAGWGGDAVVPYRREGEFGYVWKTVWDSAVDAREFVEGYRGVLHEHGAVEKGDGVYVIPDGGFSDAFRVTRRGDTVVVVNAPTRDALPEVHAPPR